MIHKKNTNSAVLFVAVTGAAWTLVVVLLSPTAEQHAIANIMETPRLRLIDTAVLPRLQVASIVAEIPSYYGEDCTGSYIYHASHRRTYCVVLTKTEISPPLPKPYQVQKMFFST